MALLILGLLIFLGIHSVQIFASDWREAQITTRGENAWKGIYSIASLVGLVVLIYGYGVARDSADLIFIPPDWSRSALHIAMPVSIVLFVAAQLPMGYLKKGFRHPLLWGTIIWSTFHLLANGDAASVLLFAGFLIWAVLDLISASRRPSGEPEAAKAWPDLAAMVIGFIVTGIFVAFLHQWITGMPVI